MKPKLTGPDSDFRVGGVTSSWNFFSESGRVTIRKASGAVVTTDDGRERFDWLMGWGSLILGHQPPYLAEVFRDAAELGFGNQFETEHHAALAREICTALGYADRVRLANTGSEATLHALRIARRVTGRKKVIKFEGHFHGLNDYLLFGVDGGPRLGALSADGSVEPVAGSAGLPEEELGELVIVLPFNDLNVVHETLRHRSGEVAAIILEPIALNVGCLAPEPGFISGLRHLCDEYGALLIFDEVLTGFRVARGGAAELFGVAPDLACFGKALGAGFPVAAVAGRSEYMDVLAPVGPVQMAGTNTGRLLSVLGTLAALRETGREGFYEELGRRNDYMVAGLRTVFDKYRVPASILGFGGRIGVFIGNEQAPKDFRDITTRWNRAYHVACYNDLSAKRDTFGFLLPLGPCPEPVTMSIAHDLSVIDGTLERLGSTLQELPYFQG